MPDNSTDQDLSDLCTRVQNALWNQKITDRESLRDAYLSGRLHPSRTPSPVTIQLVFDDFKTWSMLAQQKIYMPHPFGRGHMCIRIRIWRKNGIFQGNELGAAFGHIYYSFHRTPTHHDAGNFHHLRPPLAKGQVFGVGFGSDIAIWFAKH